MTIPLKDQLCETCGNAGKQYPGGIWCERDPVPVQKSLSGKCGSWKEKEKNDDCD
jgi:hypothetical protein